MTSLGPKTTSLCDGRIAWLTTWNQQCGLATYAKFLLSRFEPGSILVLAEETDQRTSEDENWVKRCWSRKSPDLSRVAQLIKEYNIKLLHLNFHSGDFVPVEQWASALKAIKQSGVRIVSHLHSTFSVNRGVTLLGEIVDKIVVHADQNKLQVIACGVEPERVFVLPHGVHAQIDLTPKDHLRKKLGMPVASKIITAFGFTQPHKGMEGVLESVAHLCSKGIDCVGYIVGGAIAGNPSSEQYLQQLKALCAKFGLERRVTFISRFVSDDEVSEFLKASDVVLMNYQSQHFEASGACSLAVGAGALVATSLAPPFIAFGDAVWQITSGFPVALSIEALITNEKLQHSLKENAQRYIKANSWSEIRKKLELSYTELGVRALNSKIATPSVVTTPQVSQSNTAIKVLMQNRPTALTHPGGDTILMNRIKDGLEKLGVKVTVDLDGKEDPKNFDIVHLFNFATPAYTQALGERAHAAGVPFVVSTLCEDVPSFHFQSRAMSEALAAYVQHGQDRNWWAANKPNVALIQGCQPFDNAWTAKHAAALFPNGAREAATLKRDYPEIKRIVEIKLGYEVAGKAASNPDLFIKEYGISDFIFCVGRFESRKNQLMLLKALEDVDLPLVFASGGFTYQPGYDQAIRNFKRKGKTIVLGRLSDEMLSSAYAAAKVHVLPSWYELPGLVSLEAGYYGCNVVVTNNGTARDYFGDKAFYCDAWDENSIREATLAAFNTPLKEGLKEVVMSNTWDSVANKTLATYEETLGRGKDGRQASHAVYDLDSAVTEFQELVERGEIEAKNRNYAEAHKLLAQAEGINPTAARMLRARGAVFMAESRVSESQAYFDRALMYHPEDARSLIGRGMCEMMSKQPDRAYPYFVKALRNSPNELVAIHQLVECSFALQRFHDLREILEIYLRSNPGDMEMQYCLAGCLYKQNDIQGSARIAERILSQNPTHPGAMQLRNMIAEKTQSAPQTAAAPTPTAAPTAAIGGNILAQAVKPTATAGEVIKVAVAGIAGAASHAGISVTPPSQPVSNAAVSPATVVKTYQTLAPSTIAPRAATTTSAASSFSIPKMGMPNSIDMELDKLEEAKRFREKDRVLEGTDRILASPLANDLQKEKARILQAEIAVLNGEVDRARGMYREILAKNPSSPRGLCGEGAIKAYEGRWSEAEQIFRQAFELDGNCDMAMAGIAMSAANKQNLSEAWEWYEKALTKNPENARALLGVIELGYPLKRLDRVEAWLQLYLERNPVDFNFVYSLAGCYFAQNKLLEAREEVEKILIFEPQHTRAIELRGMIAAKLEGRDVSSGAV